MIYAIRHNKHFLEIKITSKIALSLETFQSFSSAGKCHKGYLRDYKELFWNYCIVILFNTLSIENKIIFN